MLLKWVPVAGRGNTWSTRKARELARVHNVWKVDLFGGARDDVTRASHVPKLSLDARTAHAARTARAARAARSFWRRPPLYFGKLVQAALESGDQKHSLHNIYSMFMVTVNRMCDVRCPFLPWSSADLSAVKNGQ